MSHPPAPNSAAPSKRLKEKSAPQRSGAAAPADHPPGDKPAQPDSPQQSSPQPKPAPAQLSPAMRQYQQFKAQYPGYVLFFRMGDFYEMFWDDAHAAAKALGVALTSRSKGGLNGEDAIPMAGVPFHSVDGYLRRMIAAGHK